MVNKLYCFVDETGQDTRGDFFLVVVVLKDKDIIPILEKQLENIEIDSGKRKLKWKKTKNSIKNKYLNALVSLKNLKKSIYYSVYKDSKEYSKLTSLTIAKAVLDKNEGNYSVTVIIDGLNDKERQVVRKELKSLKIKYKKIRGMKDEQSVFLRLADSFAGFLRDANEGAKYTKMYVKQFISSQTIVET